jgi:hypothetical protein
LLVERFEECHADIQGGRDVYCILRPDAMIPYEILRALGYGARDIPHAEIRATEKSADNFCFFVVELPVRRASKEPQRLSAPR